MDKKSLSQRFIDGINFSGQYDYMRNLWGESFDDLVAYASYATAPTEVGLSLLEHEIGRRAARKTMVLTGERCSGAKADGSDSPILLGVKQVAERLAPVSCLESKARTGREPDALSIVFSGAVKVTPEMGELVGSIMAEQFNDLTGDRYSAAVQVDELSLNTGDQGRVLGALVFARRIELVVIAHVCDHAARFGATIAADVEQSIQAENRKLEEFGQRTGTDVSKLLRVRPDFLFVSLGNWTDLDPRRGKGEGISRAREAFGPQQTPDEAIFPGKHLGLEYGARYHSEQVEIKSISYACPALSPRQMLDLYTPAWVKEHYFS